MASKTKRISVREAEAVLRRLAAGLALETDALRADMDMYTDRYETAIGFLNSIEADLEN